MLVLRREAIIWPLYVRMLLPLVFDQGAFSFGITHQSILLTARIFNPLEMDGNHDPLNINLLNSGSIIFGHDIPSEWNGPIFL